MKKRYIVVPAAMILLVGACLSGNELPDGFDRPKIYRAAKQFVSELNRRGYENCYRTFSASMQSSMSPEKLCTTLDAVLASLGSFVRFKGFSVIPKKILGEDYAVCTVKCVYAGGPATFTLSLNKDLEVSGLYIK